MIIETLHNIGDIVLFVDGSYGEHIRILNQPVDEPIQVGVIDSYGIDTNGLKCTLKLFPLEKNTLCSILGMVTISEDRIIDKLGNRHTI